MRQVKGVRVWKADAPTNSFFRRGKKGEKCLLSLALLFFTFFSKKRERAFRSLLEYFLSLSLSFVQRSLDARSENFRSCGR